MRKLLKIKAALAVGAIAAFAGGAAWAQTTPGNQLFSGGGLKEKYSASEVSAILGELEVTTTLAPYENDGTATLIAQTSGGATFFVTLVECTDPAAGIGCDGGVILTGSSNAGASYEQLNEFNTNASVAKAINVAHENVIMFGRNLFFSGGVGRDHLLLISYLFLSDMQSYVDSQTCRWNGCFARHVKSSRKDRQPNGGSANDFHFAKAGFGAKSCQHGFNSSHCQHK